MTVNNDTFVFTMTHTHDIITTVGVPDSRKIATGHMLFCDYQEHLDFATGHMQIYQYFATGHMH